MADDDIDLNKPVIIFGRDVRKIPCFRGSILWGMGSGVSSALVVFMFTSKPQLAAHCMVGVFSTVTLSYWIGCRHRWAYQKFSMGQIHGAVQRALVMDGTEEELKREKVEVVDV